MDFEPRDDNNLKGLHPVKLGIAFSHPRSLENTFGAPDAFGCVQIYKVDRVGAARQAGLKEGDIVFEVDGVRIAKLMDSSKDPTAAFSKLLAERKPGKVSHWRVYREKKEHDLYIQY
ncbi:MAG: PDZ domain-containing protein [Candidatus Melainabacteria bacterium]|jgi:S1-C subfamily serine protease|nr:PDZ domain-containing protein [Candidatus Melainabacteria bacterium]